MKDKHFGVKIVDEKKELQKAVLDELESGLRRVCEGADDSIQEVLNVNEEDNTITVKFHFNEVDRDNYKGLCHY